MLDHTGCIELDLGLLCERRSEIGADYLVYLAVSRRSFFSVFSDPKPRPRLATGWTGEACMLNATHSLGLMLVIFNIISKMLCRAHQTLSTTAASFFVPPLDIDDCL